MEHDKKMNMIIRGTWGANEDGIQDEHDDKLHDQVGNWMIMTNTTNIMNIQSCWI